DKEPFAGSDMTESAAIGGDQTFRAAPDSKGHFANFIDGVRSGSRYDLNCDVEIGHMSTVLPLIANIAYRVGDTLRFNGEFEQFINHEEADLMLSRKYRYPYVVPKNV
ncbi:MAG: gfo/Idh/MocA family oxidoreductase, partial [Maribacter sp.]|nr:gfo/Idh/MocA family oxidoreductase [Maribacter sp.]